MYQKAQSRKLKFRKTEKVYRDIILQMCTKNHTHIMYASRDMKCDRQNLFSFLTIFNHLYKIRCPTRMYTWTFIISSIQ